MNTIIQKQVELLEKQMKDIIRRGNYHADRLQKLTEEQEILENLIKKLQENPKGEKGK